VKVTHNGKDSLVVTAHKTKIFTKINLSSLALRGNSWRVRLGFSSVVRGRILSHTTNGNLSDSHR